MPAALLASVTTFATALQTAGTEAPTPISAPVSDAVATPDVAWRALLPLIILGVGAVLLLTVTSLFHKRKLPSGFHAGWTIVTASLAMLAVVPLWARVQGWDHIFWWDLDTGVIGAFSTMGTKIGRAHV